MAICTLQAIDPKTIYITLQSQTRPQISKLTEQENTCVNKNHMRSVNTGYCLNILSIRLTKEQALVYAASTEGAYLLPIGSIGLSSKARAKKPR